ncbi:MAG: MerR family transcriptional regulator [Treponema sp.]|nr:MerR family transcriptional regulator [Treponema sp.]
MASYGIGDIERMLKVKVHVIRYWEKEIPLIQPDKDTYGRRMYRDRDLQILFRLKHLLYERRFTLEGAKAQLYRELAGEYQDLRGHISALRSELLDLFFFIRRNGCEDTARKENTLDAPEKRH